jgi:hypothetical protein
MMKICRGGRRSRCEEGEACEEKEVDADCNHCDGIENDVENESSDKERA